MIRLVLNKGHLSPFVVEQYVLEFTMALMNVAHKLLFVYNEEDYILHKKAMKRGVTFPLKTRGEGQ